MSNRTEMLHFRATPEEKAAIEDMARQNGKSLSEWMRERSMVWSFSIQSDQELQDRWVSKEAQTQGVRIAPTQPVVGNPPCLRCNGESMVSPSDRCPECGGDGGETYEQFMERRVPELCGENPSVAEIGDAEIAARAEWVALEP
jgi:hypothetical protein